MTFTAQDFIALPIVLGALTYLAWYVQRSLLKRKSAGCSSCSGCPSSGAPADQLHSIAPMGSVKSPSKSMMGR